MSLGPTEAYYFGCIYQPGHFLYDRHYKYVDERRVPWKHLDGALAPHADDCTFNDPREGGGIKGFCSSKVGIRSRCDSIEGRALIHHKQDAGREDWTALSFWDRSIDTRSGSNSTFFFRGALDFSAASTLAQAIFPEIWNRFKFSLQEVK